MKSKEWRCCGEVTCCVSANEVNTADCSQKDAEGNCCGDESKCAPEFGIDEESCVKAREK